MIKKGQGLIILGRFVKVILFFAIIVSFFGLSLSCKKQATPTPTPSPSESTTQAPKNDMTNLDPTSALEEIKNNYTTASQKASQWQSDVALYSASAKIPPSLDWQDTIEVYTFGSQAQPANWWTISISIRSKNYVRATIPKEDYLGSNLKPVMMQHWKINYVEAFQVAEKNGGKEWREKQKDKNYQITATLAVGDPKSYLYWTIEYQDYTGSDKKTIQINAYNGEVVAQPS
ncbi:MAG: hypothetical protein NT039_01070 [Candidatus Berkelbacteria bacterium]|nr:hypothetical protein [Candidatus Berkelbacteria bacterium]